MDTPNCPTCTKPMEPNPARLNPDGTYGSPGDPAFVCLTEDKAHDDARKARATESARLLADALALRLARDVKQSAAAKIGAKENPTAAATAVKVEE